MKFQKPGKHKFKVTVEGYESLEKEVEIDEFENIIRFDLMSINNMQHKKKKGYKSTKSEKDDLYR